MPSMLALFLLIASTSALTPESTRINITWASFRIEYFPEREDMHLLLLLDWSKGEDVQGGQFDCYAYKTLNGGYMGYPQPVGGVTYYSLVHDKKWWYFNVSRWAMYANETYEFYAQCCSEWDPGCQDEFPATGGRGIFWNFTLVDQLEVAPVTVAYHNKTAATLSYFGDSCFSGFPTNSYLIEWSTASNFASVQSKTIDIPEELRKNTPALSATYQGPTIAGLTTGEVYYFRVKAINEWLPSEWSNVVSILIGDVPEAPTDLSITAVTDQSVSMNWTDGQAWGDAATQYDAVCGWDSDQLTGTIHRADIERLEPVAGFVPLKTYYCRVRAINSFGASAWSDPSPVWIAVPPQAPDVVTLERLSLSSIRVSWVRTYERLPVQGTTVEVSPSLLFTTYTTVSVVGPATSVEVSQLTPTYTYFVRVYSTNAAGTGSATIEKIYLSGAAFTAFTLSSTDGTISNRATGKELLVSSTTGGQVVSIGGKSLARFAGDVTAHIQNADGSLSFPVELLYVDNSLLRVQLSAGIGANLSFVLTGGGVSTALSADTVSYPAPTLTANTLARRGYGSATTALSALTQQQEVVTMDGTNFGTDASKLVVEYGPSGNPTQFEASIESVTDNQLTILTEASTSQVASNAFRVRVGGQTVTGSDTYNYPLAPTISSIAGCSGGGCTGGTTITLTGTQFSNPLYVTVGGLQCTTVNIQSATTATCVIPTLSGSNPVVAIQHNFFSDPVSITYA